ncbi:MAG: LiaF transmembrane domain-containing protein [Paludibacteraceae bacterium]
MNDDSRLAWGISLLLCGFLFLVKQLGVFPEAVEDFLFDWRNLPFAFGIVFLFAHNNKSIGLVLLGIGVLLYLKDIILWTRTLSNFIWPLLLIGAGVIVLSSTRKGSNKNEEKSDISLMKDKKHADS